MTSSRKTMKLLVAALAATLAWPATAEVYFGKGGGPQYGDTIDTYLNFAKQGRFFSTSDYGYTAGSEDVYTGAKFGMTFHIFNGPMFTRGQSPASTQLSHRPWLGDDGKTVLGLAFDSPFKPNWEGQFDQFKDKKPLFDRVVVQWGALVPKPGSWGLCVRDGSDSFRKIELDNQKPLYPYDQSTVSFPPTSVKALYIGLQGGYVDLRGLRLLLHNEPTLDNRALVFQLDAYQAPYAPDKPGTLLGLQLANAYFAPSQRQGWFSGSDSFLSDLAPFVELGGKRFRASPGAVPVAVSKDGRADVLRYTLKIAGADVAVKATFGVGLKDTVKFECEAAALPAGARLGFEMSGPADVFANYADRAAVAALPGEALSFSTPAGPFAVDLKGADKLSVAQTGDKVRFDALADGDKLGLALSLPIGPNGSLQPGMLNYNWRPSLACQGGEGIAPFERGDLELLESVDFSDPKDQHAVYDVSNDPVILEWKKSGEKKLPPEFGALKFATQPEKALVPTTTVLGQKCRAINNADTTYFRFNLAVKFQRCVPYLIVVEHAFDQERHGEFHTVGLEPDGKKIVKHNLWGASSPMGGFDTGKGPHDRRFKKESVFYFHPDGGHEANPDTIFSLCFSNHWSWNQVLKRLPEGLAIKSVQVYRVKHMPELPDLSTLLPEGARRHVTSVGENTSPWALQQIPRLAGYDCAWANHQGQAQLLSGQTAFVSRPGWQGNWHSGTLESQDWFFTKADNVGMVGKIFSQDLLDLGQRDPDRFSFEGVGTTEGGFGVTMPLSPTSGELAFAGKALDRSLSVLAKHQSMVDVSLDLAPHNLFTLRNLSDFTRETGVAFAAGPSPLENVRRLLAADQKTVDAWTKWSCQKRHEYLTWLLGTVRSHRSDLYLTIGYSWYFNPFQWAYHSAEGAFFPPELLKARGVDNFLKFLRFTGHDPALYAGEDGFCFSMEKAREFSMSCGHKVSWGTFYREPWFKEIRDGFGGGLSIVTRGYDEGSKPLRGWQCSFARDRQSFRRDLVEALLYANARDFVLETYYYDPFRGRLDDLRSFAVPFRLLPFVQPGEFAGKLSDSAKQAVIQKYGDRYALMNVGDKPTDVTLTLPEGMDKLFDLSNGVRQELPAPATIHLESWTLKTLEIK